MTWDEAKEAEGCDCPRSDAWKCLRLRRPNASDQVACHCRCHRYIVTEKGVSRGR